MLKGCLVVGETLFHSIMHPLVQKPSKTLCHAMVSFLSTLMAYCNL